MKDHLQKEYRKSHGKFDGLCISYKENGNKIESEWRDGKLEGKYREWDMFRGIIITEQVYENGELVH